LPHSVDKLNKALLGAQNLPTCTYFSGGYDPPTTPMIYISASLRPFLSDVMVTWEIKLF